MKKILLAVTATFGTILALTACGGNADTDTSDSISETKAEIQVEAHTDKQEEIQTAIQEENEENTQQIDEPTTDDQESEIEEGMEDYTEMKMNVQVGD